MITISRARVWSPLRDIAAVALAGVIAGCGGGGATSSSGGISGELNEKINGISVPPVPESIANSATVAGVDSNGNGIRDDVDRVLATEFGQNDSAYQVAVNYARTLQAALTIQTPIAVENHIALLRCVNDPNKLADLKKITLATIDGPRRGRAYARTFAGVVISSGGCP